MKLLKENQFWKKITHERLSDKKDLHEINFLSQKSELLEIAEAWIDS